MPHVTKDYLIAIVDERFSHYWQRVYKKNDDWEEEPRSSALRLYVTQKEMNQDRLFAFLRACDMRETAISNGKLCPEANLEAECQKLVELAQVYEKHDYRKASKDWLSQVTLEELTRNSKRGNTFLHRSVCMAQRDRSADIDTDGIPAFVKK